MVTKTYIIIIMIMILILLIYYSNVFSSQSEHIDSSKKILNSNYTNIDNLDIKQLKNIMKEQNETLEKQKKIIEEYLEKIEKNKKKYNTNIINPSEDVEMYFKQLRNQTDNFMNLNEIDEEDVIEKNKKLIQVMKRYLEDPLMRGYNIYDSEQYSKLLEIGNIQINNKNTPPNPLNWSININK